jgi:2-alkyl-3-oxoalkanoate reductase
MRVFIAGATGVLGRRLVPMLLSEGHEVVGTTRSKQKAMGLRQAGVEPVVLEGLNGAAVHSAVRAARPQVIVHELTGLEGKTDIRTMEEAFEATNRLRTDGTDILISAAREAGVRRMVAQSFTGWPNERTGGPVKTEEDPLDRDPPTAMRAALDAIEHFEHAVTHTRGLDGLVLRYGTFYGPGTTLSEGGEYVEQIRRRRFPVWLARLLTGEAGVALMTSVRGSSNAKAKRELGWQPRYPSWRSGFRLGLGTVSERAA